MQKIEMEYNYWNITLLIFRIYDRERDEIRYRAVYFGTLETLEPFYYKDEDEMERIMLWDFTEDIGYVDTVDLKMIKMLLEA